MNFCVLPLLVASILLSGCSSQEPVLIGFIGGLSDSNSDSGQAGLEAVTLAVEQFNRAGGLDGRMVQVLARDDAQDADTAARAARELVNAKVAAVIGPFTSAMAVATVPVTGQAGVFQVSPVITSMTFFGRDDNLFRVNRTTRDNARDYAAFMMARGQRRFAVAYDTRNRDFTQSWLNEFRVAVTSAGASVVAEVPYESGASTDYAAVVREMMREHPDSLFFISGALDVAKLAKQARQQAPQLPIGAAEWAATEHLLELGGSVVDGLLIVQNYDRDDRSERYTEFSEAYFQSFQHNPGYSSVSAYDAATVVLQALKNRRPEETLKASALRNSPYQGLQQQIAFDANGDTNRNIYFTEIHKGRFVKVK